MPSVLPVSVVIPAYRRPRLVALAVASALAQDPAPAEVIVVDDASGDGTAEAAEAAGAEVLRLPRNTGEGGARTAGVERAQHEWTAFLDSDDEWLPGHLGRLWSARDGVVLVAENGIGSVTRRTHGHPHPGRVRRLRTPADLFWPDNPVVVSGTMASRAALLRAGGFGSRALAADLAAWVELLEQGPGLVLGTTGVLYREHAEQASQDREGMQEQVVDLLRSCAGRSWYSPALLRRTQAKDAWDRLRTAERARDGRKAGRELRLLALNPATARALPEVWRWRRAQRATARPATPSRP